MCIISSLNYKRTQKHGIWVFIANIIYYALYEGRIKGLGRVFRVAFFKYDWREPLLKILLKALKGFSLKGNLFFLNCLMEILIFLLPKLKMISMSFSHYVKQINLPLVCYEPYEIFVRKTSSNLIKSSLAHINYRD